MGVKIRQKRGQWYVFINHQGKRKAKRIGTDKRVAIQAQKQIEAKLALGDLGLLAEKPDVILFRDYAEQWLQTYVERTCKPSSARTIRQIVRGHLLPAFGALAVGALTRQHVKDFLATKGCLSAMYVRGLLKVCSMLMNHAQDDGLIASNPAARLGAYLPSKAQGEGEDTQAFTSDELAGYLAAMQTQYPQYYPLFLTLAHTGMREGEALGLRWGDLQFGRDDDDRHRFLHVQRTYDPVHNRMNTPKSGKTRRVDMSTDLRACLLEWQATCFDTAVLAGRSAPPALLFVGRTGRPWAPRWLYTLHQRACVLAGLRATRVHDLRHSYATIMLHELGMPVQYVSEQLGHSSIAITVDTYGHPRQGMNTHLVDQLAQRTRLAATLPQPERHRVV